MNGYCFAQNNLGKSDDLTRISLTSVVADLAENLPEPAIGLLGNKMQQIATINGLGASSLTSRFIITVNLAVLTKDIIPGPPTMIAQNLEATFYIADYQQKKVFSTITIALKGIGINETKAYIAAIKNIKSTSPDLKRFVELGKNKIIEYYNSQCDFIIKDAQAKSSMKQYVEAVSTLSAIPDVCKDCYMKALSAMEPIYKLYIDDQCRKLLNTAQNSWNGSQNSGGADAAGLSLSSIDPEAACFGEAKQLMAQIEQKVLADEKREWNFKMKQQKDGINLEKQRIEAYRAVGEAYGLHQTSTAYNLKGWLW